MKRKYLNELTNDELLKVFENNEKLRYEVAEDFQDSQIHYVEEILHCFKKHLRNWSIGFGSLNFIHVKEDEHNSFLEGLKQANTDYGFTGDETDEKIEKALKLIYEIDQVPYENETEYSRLETLYDELFEDIVDDVTKVLNDLTEYPNKETLKDYFIGFYEECRMDKENMFVYSAEGKYTLYEEIQYIKDYA